MYASYDSYTMRDCWGLACVAGGISERASARRRGRHITSRASPASEIPACHILYGFCLPPTFIAFDESIK